MPGKVDLSLFLARGALLCAFGSLVMLGGCGKKEGANGGQVIAHVGTDDITSQELENEFRLANVPMEKRNDDVTRRAMTEIVGRKYLARRAISAKIDREPTVQLDLLRDKEQMLARTLAQRNLLASVAVLGQSDISQFIDRHPTQFSKRVVFKTDQVIVPADAVTPALGQATKDLRTIADLESKLQSLKIPYQKANADLDSITIPPEMVAQLLAKTDDDLYFTRSNGNGVYFKIIEVRPSPLAGPDAERLAREIMTRDMATAASEEAIRDAKNMTTYEGDYTRIMQPAPAQAAVDAKPAAEPAKAAPAK